MNVKDLRLNQLLINNEIDLPCYNVLPTVASRNGAVAFQNSDKKLYVWKVNQWVAILDMDSAYTLANSPGASSATLVDGSPQAGPAFLVKTLTNGSSISMVNGTNTVTINCTALDTIPTRNWKAGTGSVVGTQDDVAVGNNAQALINGSVAVGSASTAVDNSVAVGYLSNASTQSSVAIGSNAVASALGSISVGYSTYAVGDCVVIGFDAAASALDGIAIGHQATVSSQQSTAVGSKTTIDATSPDSVTLGYFTNVYSASAYGVAVGSQATVGSSSNDAVSIGYIATTSSPFGVSIGSNALISTTASDSVAMGYKATVNTSSSNSIAIGSNSLVGTNADNSVAIGYTAKVANSSANSVAIGYLSLVDTTSVRCVSIGRRATINSNSGDVVAIGDAVTISSSNSKSVVIGATAESEEINTTAVGYGTYVQAGSTNAVAIGYQAEVSNGATNAIALGAGVKNLTTDSALIGFGSNFVVNSAGFFKSVKQVGLVRRGGTDTFASGTSGPINWGGAVYFEGIPTLVGGITLPDRNQAYLVTINFWAEDPSALAGYFDFTVTGVQNPDNLGNPNVTVYNQRYTTLVVVGAAARTNVSASFVAVTSNITTTSLLFTLAVPGTAHGIDLHDSMLTCFRIA